VDQAGLAQCQPVPGLGGFGRERLQRRPGNAPDAKRVARIGQSGLGAQHEHRQPLERRRQHIPAADQQDVLLAALETDEAGLDAAFRGAEGGQPRLGRAEQREVLGQLVVQKRGRIRAFDPDHAQMG